MHRSLLSAAVALALAALPALHANAAPAASAGAAQEATTQLPRGVIPSHYDISLTPDAAAKTFSAKASITINVTKATSSITLNAADLKFANATLTPAGGGAQGAQAAKVSVDAANQTATFTFEQPVKPGMYRLATDYTA
jgi:hypothetical protein